MHQRRAIISWTFSTLLLAAALFASATGGAKNEPPRPVPTPAQAAFFESKVRPLLHSQCVPCHSATVQSGGVRLDTPMDTMRTLVPGNAEKSQLFHVIRYDSKKNMPPDGKLPAADIAVLRDWIQMGAPWPTANKSVESPLMERAKWWAFQPVKSVKPPTVKNTGWAKSAVDRFILARLEQNQLTPAPSAGKRVLIRRAYYDLIGLPPTPAQVEAFVQDTSPNAFAKVVDGLLASPHYGERWARHWLDVARYADSNGLDENKAFAYAFRYRDWVVRSLNQDEPYNRFLQDQIAGDLLDSGTNEVLRNERVTATGFLMLGAKVLAEQDKPRMVMDIVDEQIDVTAKATMGLTIACARCHDHKFDPISTKDYYALAGIFKSTKTMRNLDFVSQWNNRMLTTRELDATRKQQTDALMPLEKAVGDAVTEANRELSAGLRRDVDKYIRAGAELSRQPGVLLSVAEIPERAGDPKRLVVEATSFVRGNAVRDTGNYGKGIGVIITDGAPVSAEWEIELPTAGNYQLELKYAAEESRPVRIHVNGKQVADKAAGRVTGGWFVDAQRWEAQGIYSFAAGKNTLRIDRDAPLPHISRILIVPARQTPPMPSSSKALTAQEIAQRDGLSDEVLTRFAHRLQGMSNPDGEKARLLTDNSLFAAPQKPDGMYSEAAKKSIGDANTVLDTARKAIPPIPLVMAVEDSSKIEDVKVHLRGDTQLLGEVAPRGFPAAITKICAPETVDMKSSGRLAFARWLTRPEHPLTGRVAVNRMWQHLYGTGLVATPDNWGLKGEKPTHPELLDYLARVFVTEDGWSQKRFLRRLMLSATYQMASTTPHAAKAARVDPENRLLWRMNRRRLEAEPLRDAVLQVSGTLDRTIGGSLLDSKDDDYVTDDQSKDRALYGFPRRSLYLPVIRNSVYGLFQAFDFGDATSVNAQRSSTTVAPQALFLLNSPLVRDASLAFAESLSGGKSATTDDARIREAYYRALSRPATPTDIRRATAFLARYETALVATEPDTSKRHKQAWQGFCQALFATNEFIYVN